MIYTLLLVGIVICLLETGVIGVGGLILCRIPRETVDERSEYFNAKTRDQMLSVDNDLMKEENPAMPINKSRQSRVTFGGNRGE